MTIIAKILIALVALEHVYFLVLEMFLWTAPRTRAAFGMSAEQAEQTKVLAGNQPGSPGPWLRLQPMRGHSRCFSSAACWLPAFTEGFRPTSASGCCRRCRRRSRCSRSFSREGVDPRSDRPRLRAC